MLPLKRTACRKALGSLGLLAALYLLRRFLEAGLALQACPPRARPGLGGCRPRGEKGPPAWDVEVSNCTADARVLRQAWVGRGPTHIRQFMLHRHCRYFPMLHNHPEKCSGHVHLLLAVKSSLARADRREAIRQTWGREAEARGGRGAVRTLFLLGSNLRDKARDPYAYLVGLEDRLYRDILQWDFLDSFFNLTLKEVNFLRWLELFCPRVSFIFKGDDDVFVSPANLLQFLEERSPREDLLLGHVLYGARPIRRQRSKYYVPRPLYNRSFYPPYVAGGGYLLSRRVAHRLHVASQSLELYPIDDVFLGMCLRVLPMSPTPHPGFKSFGIAPSGKSPLNRDPCVFRSMMMVHRLQPEELLEMWERVHGRLNCSRLVGFYGPEAREEARPRGRVRGVVAVCVLMCLTLVWARQ
ncbi:UDP-GlcNAc:betaGal beta-1,3-N-acetylglucosaminyltransferase 7-like [Notamacropus eugenii]|uniref:UDP-GlcNAc:betaGal beta-1,3-N-acetylglucosaminyltransferase 7-like n=1 Tax=Notamacropus eugenii TaxID=9315 RepID=UPI003B6727C7